MIVVSKHPPLFPKADDVHAQCGAYQLRAVLHACGAEAPVSELYYSPKHALRDWSLPWLMPRVLKRHDISARWHFWPRRRTLKAQLVSAIERDQPTLFVINSIRGGTGCLHWISAWGYDEATDEFICYDSQAPTTFGTHKGNTRYSSDLLTASLPWWGTYALLVNDRTS